MLAVAWKAPSYSAQAGSNLALEIYDLMNVSWTSRDG